VNDLVPVYQQIKEVIRRRITDGVYSPMDKIPSESDFVKEFGASRLTVRQAIGILVQEGILVSRRGAGSFVTSDRKMLENLNRRFCASIADFSYHKERLRTLSAKISVVPMSPVIRQRLCLGGEEANIVEVTRVRFAESIPTVVTKSYLPLKYGRKLDEKKLKKSLIMELLEKDMGIILKRVHQSMEATFAAKGVANLLGIPSGSPMLMVERVMMTARSKPIVLSISWFRGDIFRYLEIFRITRREGKLVLVNEGFKAKERNLLALECDL
jgi:GntR family transcriptional regulator